MPNSTRNQDFVEYHFYTNKDFTVILQAFDILCKHDNFVKNTNSKFTEKLKSNGCRSFVLRVFILQYVLNRLNKTDSNNNRIFDDEFSKVLLNAINKQKAKYHIA